MQEEILEALDMFYEQLDREEEEFEHDGEEFIEELQIHLERASSDIPAEEVVAAE